MDACLSPPRMHTLILLLKLLLYSETFFVKQIHCHFVVHGHNVQPVVSIYELF